MILDAYRKPLDLPEADTLPVAMLHFRELNKFLCKSLNGENYATGSSIFSGKLQEKLFSEKIRLEQNRDPRYHADKFFDAEGSVLPEDKCLLIENGQLLKVLSDKKTLPFIVFLIRVRLREAMTIFHRYQAHPCVLRPIPPT